MNRPERMNALSPELSQALVEAGSDPDIRCIVLTAVGDRAFCDRTNRRAAIRQRPRSDRAVHLQRRECRRVQAQPVAQHGIRVLAQHRR